MPLNFELGQGLAVAKGVLLKQGPHMRLLGETFLPFGDPPWKEHAWVATEPGPGPQDDYRGDRNQTHNLELTHPLPHHLR